MKKSFISQNSFISNKLTEIKVMLYQATIYQTMPRLRNEFDSLVFSYVLQRQERAVRAFEAWRAKRENMA